MILWSVIFKTWAFITAFKEPILSIILWLLSALLDFTLSRQTAAFKNRLISTLVLQIISLGWALGAYSAFSFLEANLKSSLMSFAYLVSFLTKSIGLPCSVSNEGIAISSMSGPLTFVPSTDQLGLKFFALIWMIGMGYLMLLAQDWSRLLLRGTAAILAISWVIILRFMLFIVFTLFLAEFTDYETEELPIGWMYEEWFIAGSGTFVLLIFYPLIKDVFNPNSTTFVISLNKHLIIRALVLFVINFIAQIALCWKEHGTEKAGRIGIYITNTFWSKMDTPYDTEWYGGDSGYNYACLRSWLEKFYEVRLLKEPLTDEILNELDVLIIYLPTLKLQSHEQRLIIEFVRRGGGLFIIGDHTNVFGSTTVLNEICRHFGLELRDDVLFDIKEDFFQIWRPNNVRHPVVKFVDLFKMRGSASIRSFSLWPEPVMILYHSKSLRAIYSVNNFYPAPKDQPNMQIGQFWISVAVRYGNGRVLVFADSTVFSNFELFYPGKYELILGAIQWLNRKQSLWLNSLQKVGWIIFWGGLFIVFLYKKSTPKHAAIVLGMILITLLLASKTTLCIENWQIKLPQVRQPLAILFFITDPEDPVYALTQFVSPEPYEHRFDIFIQWILRVKAFPAFYLTKQSDNKLYVHLLSQPNTKVAIGAIFQNESQANHLVPIIKKELHHVDRLLLLFSSQISNEKFIQILEGIIPSLPTVVQTLSRKEGIYIAKLEGKTVAIITNAERFSDREMGYTEKVVPSPQQRQLYEKEFNLIKQLFELDLTQAKDAK